MNKLERENLRFIQIMNKNQEEIKNTNNFKNFYHQNNEKKEKICEEIEKRDTGEYQPPTFE